MRRSFRRCLYTTDWCRDAGCGHFFFLFLGRILGQAYDYLGFPTRCWRNSSTFTHFYVKRGHDISKLSTSLCAARRQEKVVQGCYDEHTRLRHVSGPSAGTMTALPRPIHGSRAEHPGDSLLCPVFSRCSFVLVAFFWNSLYRAIIFHETHCTKLLSPSGSNTIDRRSGAS